MNKDADECSEPKARVDLTRVLALKNKGAFEPGKAGEAKRQAAKFAGTPTPGADAIPGDWLDALVGKWRNAAAKERLYAAQCQGQDEKYWVEETAGIFEACAKELTQSAKRAPKLAETPTQTCPDCNEPIIVGTPCETCRRWNEQDAAREADYWTVKTPDGHLVHTVLALAPQDTIEEWLRTEAALNLLRNASLRARGLPGCRMPQSWEQFEAEGYSVVPVKIVLLPQTHLQGLVHSMRPARPAQEDK